MPEGNGSHLSIGEVLGLLLEEFPDVTISKIRFLESQGLIAPERTPSGYRKFFHEDVELLRVILREQRENFLPLRVIKDRIDSGEIETPADAVPANGVADASTPESDDRRQEPDGDAEPDGARQEQPTRASIANHPSAGRTPRSATAGRATTGGATEPRRGTAAAARPTDAPPETPPRPPGAARLLPGVLVNRDELCAMASITAAELAQLEEYGVVTKRGGAGELYGDDAVAIAATSGAFMRAGIDVRHLRAWRTSAEREAGLYEQLILPLLRQRNPQSRHHAAEQLDELSSLGGKLRAAMMRAALRHHLDV
jgi:DNA-binding transcriptional MerR regulator